MNELLCINPENISANIYKKFTQRTSARGIIFDEENNIALLHVTQKGYYKLPGGGIDEGESLEEGFKRECQEEAGVEIATEQEIGIITEIIPRFEQVNTSHVFIGHVVGSKHNPTFTDHEKGRGFELLWVPFEKAYRLVKESDRSDYKGNFIVERDLRILNEMKKKI